MATKCFPLIACLLVLGISLQSSTKAVAQFCDEKTVLNRHNFPANFTFGVATAAYQIEGAYDIDGKGPNMWDTYTHDYPERMKDKSNGDVAVDSYHRYEDDVKMMKQMNVDAYRFSVSWSRILPDGKLHGKIGKNQKGIDYYNKLIDHLLYNGLEPYVTLFHWDTPQHLEDEYEGFLSEKIVLDFVDFADVCFEHFGDRVKKWITFNEPWSYSFGGYETGSHPPGHCSDWQILPRKCLGGNSSTEPYIVTHHQLLAHAETVKLYREKYQKTQEGVIGMTLISNWFEPLSPSADDYDASIRAMDFMLGWYLDPLKHGDYPCSMRTLVGGRLPHFTEEQSEKLAGSYDFIGLNYYTTRYVHDLTHHCFGKNISYETDHNANLTALRDGHPIGPQAGSEWIYVYPPGIYNLTLYVKEKYGDPIIYITENGVDEVNNPDDTIIDILEDDNRVQYHCDHLLFIEQAIKDGVNIKGYFAWSLLDNFEWASGYTVRFGLNHVDREKNNTRRPKLSAQWFGNILSTEDNYNKFKPSPIQSVLKYGDAYNKFKPRIYKE